MTTGSSGNSATLLDRIAAPPSRRAGIVWAFLALAMMLVGVVVVPSVLVGETDQVTLIRWFLGGNALAFLGFLPLLRAVHAVIDVRAVPGWAMLVAYLVLLVRPLALTLDIVAAPLSLLADLPFDPTVLAYLLLASTGIAAGFVGWSLLPLAQNAASPARRAVVAIGVGVLVALALFSFSPYIAPLSALGVAVALMIRTGRFDRSNGPAGQH